MLQATYPGVSIRKGSYIASQKKSFDFSTLFLGFYDDEEYFAQLNNFNDAKQDNFLKLHPEYFRAVKNYFENGGVLLYILNFPLHDRIDVLSVSKFMKDKCDNLNDLEVICTLGLIERSKAEQKITQDEAVKVIHAVNIYAHQTDRISITDINNIIKNKYLDRLGESVVYYPWFVDKLNNLVAPSVVSAALMSKLAYQGAFFNSIANKSISNLHKLSDDLSTQENIKLYEDGINPITLINKQGLKIWGVKAFNSKYESVNEMRVLKYIKRQLKRLSREYVFETNTDELNGRLYIDVSQFLFSLWEIGALSGNSKQEAFSVSSDVSNLDNKRSQLTFRISVAISKPLEFIVITLNRIDYDGAQESLSVES